MNFPIPANLYVIGMLTYCVIADIDHGGLG